MRPVIGITAYTEPATWGVWRDAPITLLPHAYVRAVTAAGARAVVLPPDDLDADVLDRLDGLVLAGGADLHPALYGADPEPLTDPRPDRDAGEVTLLRAALDRDLPVLGVCRGMQLLGAVYGGRLHQHLPDALGHDGHRPGPGVYGTHPVRWAPGSRIAALMGDDTEVNTYHHQGLADPGGLTVTGWAPDGLPEAVEDPAKRFVLGVQWHPEAAGDLRTFAALVGAC
jgi:putative glutamine amidotransferase